MSSTNKTEYLNLNQWLGSDRPQRIDFVDDNRIIDNAIKLHCLDTSRHLSAEQYNKLQNPYVFVSYVGDGSESKVIDIGVDAKFIIVFAKDTPFTQTDSSDNIIINACFTAKSNGTTGGAVIGDSTVTVYSDAAANNGIKYNLNKNNGQYCIVAFK